MDVDTRESPLRMLAAWIREARKLGIKDPDAMALATATPAGQPSVRMVLCRGIDDDGLRFFTNYESRKGRELATNGHAAVVFHWRELNRQVRVEGEVSQVSPEVSDEYFASRPRGNRDRLDRLAAEPLHRQPGGAAAAVRHARGRARGA